MKLSDNQKNDLEEKLDKTSEKVNRFKSDKLYLALSIVALILVSVGAHYMHRQYNIPWPILSIPLTMMLLSTLVGYFKGFSKGWTIGATVFSIALSYGTFVLRSEETKNKMTNEQTDMINEKLSGLKKKVRKNK